MILHFEDAEGNVKELDFIPRLPTGQAREQLRVAIAESIKKGKEFDKKNPASVINKNLTSATEGMAKDNLTVEEKAAAGAAYVAAAEAVNAYNAETNTIKQDNNRILLKIIASNETKALLTDTMLQSLDIEEVDEVITQFRARIKI